METNVVEKTRHKVEEEKGLNLARCHIIYVLIRHKTQTNKQTKLEIELSRAERKCILLEKNSLIKKLLLSNPNDL